MKELGRRICNLLTIKSLVTLVLTGCFAFLAIRGSVCEEVFISIYSAIIGFYYGTQRTKDESNNSSDDTNKTDIEN